MLTDLAMAALLQFYDRIDIFLIIFVRILSFILIIPVLSGSSIPNLAKIIFSVACAFMLFSAEQVPPIAVEHTVVSFLFILIQEFFVGVTLGFVVYLIFASIFFAGQMIDYQMGLSMVNVFDPQTQMQVPITGTLIHMTMMVMLIITGGLHLLVQALALSYVMIPVGTEILLENENLYMYIVGLLVDFFSIGIRIAMPITGSLIIMDVALGILVKAVPQMNVFVVGLPMKLLVGTLILYLIIPNMVQMFDTIFAYTDRVLGNVMGLLSP